MHVTSISSDKITNFGGLNFYLKNLRENGLAMLIE